MFGIQQVCNSSLFEPHLKVLKRWIDWTLIKLLIHEIFIFPIKERNLPNITERRWAETGLGSGNVQQVYNNFTIMGALNLDFIEILIILSLSVQFSYYFLNRDHYCNATHRSIITRMGWEVSAGSETRSCPDPLSTVAKCSISQLRPAVTR